ncbi:hypothetical protein QBC46DRAFT_125472 [Diplogelasinospora grovesii]|uniref:Secreted protein n=1 Tax=Diplogelasinospora grovesii TaxID=303347 RepID=A0AAN6S4R8_9PEZI|nr:hypothetical protein QBC46DRAFT_125472 [Diplogelasinospora grovesii]
MKSLLVTLQALLLFTAAANAFRICWTTPLGMLVGAKPWGPGCGGSIPVNPPGLSKKNPFTAPPTPSPASSWPQLPCLPTRPSGRHQLCHIHGDDHINVDKLRHQPHGRGDRPQPVHGPQPPAQQAALRPEWTTALLRACVFGDYSGLLNGNAFC